MRVFKFTSIIALFCSIAIAQAAENPKEVSLSPEQVAGSAVAVKEAAAIDAAVVEEAPADAPEAIKEATEVDKDGEQTG